MKNALITGATGMVGGLVLEDCLNSDAIKSVTSIVRRSSNISHPKLKEIIHDNFLDYSSLTEQFKSIDVAYFCIGVYTGAVPADKFKEITVDYTIHFANALKATSPNVTFCFLSGQGADPKEKSRVQFARDKGVAENYLIKQDFGQLYIFRPGYIYPITAREEPNFTYRIMRKLWRPVSAIYPNIGVTSKTLADAMFSAGMNGAKKTIMENADFRNFPNESSINV